MKWFVFFISLACLTAVGGCTSIAVEGDPPGGKTYLRGQYLGTAPFVVTLWAGDDADATTEMVLPGHDRSECPHLPRPPGNHMLEMTSAPPGAQVYIDDAYAGTSPFFTRVWFPSSIRVVFPKDSASPAPQPAKPPAVPAGMVSCDVRIIRVSDGTAVSEASGRCRADDLQSLAKALVEKLKEDMLVKDETIAVGSLRNRSGDEAGKVVADEAADKIAGALISAKWFEVKERIDLRALLEEKDLETASIVQNPKLKQKLGGIKYLLIGGVTVSRQR
jgi:hypothetical protein